MRLNLNFNSGARVLEALLEEVKQISPRTGRWPALSLALATPTCRRRRRRRRRFRNVEKLFAFRV